MSPTRRTNKQFQKQYIQTNAHANQPTNIGKTPPKFYWHDNIKCEYCKTSHHIPIILKSMKNQSFNNNAHNRAYSCKQKQKMNNSISFAVPNFVIWITNKFFFCLTINWNISATKWTVVYFICNINITFVTLSHHISNNKNIKNYFIFV